MNVMNKRQATENENSNNNLPGSIAMKSKQNPENTWKYKVELLFNS